MFSVKNNPGLFCKLRVQVQLLIGYLMVRQSIWSSLYFKYSEGNFHSTVHLPVQRLDWQKLI